MQTYETKIKGFKEDLSDGKIGSLTRKYIVTNAITCGMAENSASIAAAHDMRDTTCTSVIAKNITEIINSDADRLWYVKVQESVADMLTGKEKKVSYLYLVGASSAREASDTMSKHLDTFNDFEIVKISDSKVDIVISAE